MAPRTRGKLSSHVLSTWMAGKSTKWAGFTRFGIYFIMLTAVIAFAQLAVGYVLQDDLLPLTNEAAAVRCLGQTGYTVKTPPMTLVYQNDDRTGGDGLAPLQRWSVDPAASYLLILFHTVAVPFFTLIIPVYMICQCFRRRSVPSRVAFGAGFWMLCMWLLFFTDSALYIDRRHVQWDWEECYPQQQEALRLWNDRKKRIGLLKARAWMVVAAMILISFYMLFAICAAELARKEMLRNEQRVADLPPLDRDGASHVPNNNADSTELQRFPSNSLSHPTPEDEARAEAANISLPPAAAAAARNTNDRRDRNNVDESDISLAHRGVEHDERGEFLNPSSGGNFEDPFRDPWNAEDELNARKTR